MTVRDLIEQLEQYDGDLPVMLAMQPSWPFEYSIRQVVEASDFDDQEELDEMRRMVAAGRDKVEGLEDDEWDEMLAQMQVLEDKAEQASRIVYLAEGSQTRYLPGSVAAELGWR